MRLRDVPSTIGWDAVALFLRHLPYDSELSKALAPRAQWSPETHMIANIADMLGSLFAKDYEPMARPGDVPKFSTAMPVTQEGYDEKLARFREEEPDG